MHEFYFDAKTIPGIKITIEKRGDKIIEEIIPKPNGFIGVFSDKTKLAIIVTPEPDIKHRVSTLDPKTLGQVLKKNSDSYTKNFTVDTSTGEGRVAAWPSNMICVETGERTFNIGIFSQNGRFSFVIEEYLPDPEHLPYGMVIWFSLLRGIGAVSIEDLVFDARVHWSQISKDPQTCLRWAQTGDLLEWQKLENIKKGKSSFRLEAKVIKNLSRK
jgi:hypothetical protein